MSSDCMRRVRGRLGAGCALLLCLLAGPGAAYVSGTTLHVNGGMYMV